MSDECLTGTVERRLGQIEHLLNEVLERHARASVKDRLSIERAIHTMGLELSEHRNLVEGANCFSTERIAEKALDGRLFELDRQGWEMVGMSPIVTASPENLFLVILRQSVYREPHDTGDAKESEK